MRPVSLTVPLAIALLCQTSCSPSREEQLPSHVYQMGERVSLGHLIYMVFERQWLTQIGEGLDARVPQNRFYLVRLSALNNGGSAAFLPTVSLLDDSGTAYSEIDNGDGVQEFIGPLHELAPAETVQGNLVFDVPPKHFKLKLSDEDGKQIGLVEIPLSFDADSPDVTAPLIDHAGDLTKK